jgi:hypothetical protein
MGRSIRSIALAATVAVALSGCAAAGPVVGLQEAPAAVTTVAPLAAPHARDIVSRAFTAASQADSGSGARADQARATAYAGPALTAAKARAGLHSVQPGLGAGDSPALSPSQPGLLALSRGFSWPRAMVAQTVPSGGSFPVLHLLTSPDAVTPYRITVSASMLPNSTVRRFDPLAQGSRLLTDGSGLAVAPAALVTQYAGSLSFPARAVANPAFTPDPFAGQVRQNAATQAKSVSVQSGFTQRHEVLPGSTYAVEQANGGALVFSVLRRTDTFTVKKGQSLTAPKEFTALAPGRTRITSRATMTTLEFVVFGVPATSGDATLVAASEQLVSATGS